MPFVDVVTVNELVVGLGNTENPLNSDSATTGRAPVATTSKLRVTEHPVAVTRYVMTVDPVLIPVAIPVVFPILAIEGAEDVQVPPMVVFESDAVAPTATDVGPVMSAGCGLIVKDAVLKHPALNM